MKTNKRYTSLRLATIPVMVMYVFIVVVHLFFTPKFQYNHAKEKSFNARSTTEIIYTLIRTNRCMLNDNKTTEILVKQHAGCFISLNHWNNVQAVAITKVITVLQPLYDSHFTYLNNRVLRI